MRRIGQVLIAITAIATVLAAAPAFGQTGSPTPPAPVQKQQGLGVFVQGGYVYQTTYTGGTDFSSKPQGFIAGIGFGGNKSGAVGVGVDLNYVWTNNSDTNGKTQLLNIPVYVRFNIGGHNTKNAFTFYIPAGWFFDVNLSNQIDGVNFKDAFNSLQTGPLVGAGFEVARIGVEGRAQWGITSLLSDGSVLGGTDAKQFTFILLFKVRLN